MKKLLILALLLVGCSSPMAPTETASAEKGWRRQVARAPWCDRRVQCDCRELDADLQVIFKQCEPPLDCHTDPRLGCPNPGNACQREGCPDGSACLPGPSGYECVAEAPAP